MPSTHSTRTHEATWSTQRLAHTALLVALALVLSFVELPIFPAAPYLKYDPSGIVCLLAGLAFGPATGAAVAILPWLVHLFVEPFGALMGMLCSAACVIPASLAYRARPTRAGLIGALVASGAIATCAAIVGNLLITPLYSGMSAAQVATLIVPILLPFNVMKVVINAVVAALALRPVRAMLDRRR